MSLHQMFKNSQQELKTIEKPVELKSNHFSHKKDPTLSVSKEFVFKKYRKIVEDRNREGSDSEFDIYRTIIEILPTKTNNNYSLSQISISDILKKSIPTYKIIQNESYCEEIQVIFNGINVELIENNVELKELLSLLNQYPWITFITQNMEAEAIEKSTLTYKRVTQEFNTILTSPVLKSDDSAKLKNLLLQFLCPIEARKSYVKEYYQTARKKIPKLLEKKFNIIQELDFIQASYRKLIEVKLTSPDFFNKVSRQSFIKHVFPKAEMWRFFVEGFRQKYGLKTFEKEDLPGYFEALGQAFFEIDIEKSLSIELILNIHRVAMEKNNLMVKKGEFRKNIDISYGLIYENISFQGILELIEKVKKTSGETFYFVTSMYTMNPTYYYLNAEVKKYGSEKEAAYQLYSQIIENEGDYRFVSQLIENPGEILKGDAVTKRFEAAIIRFITEYELRIKEAKNTADTLKAIVTFLRDCEQLHPLGDGNCRTFCMILFSYLCLKNDFPPPLMYDANMFDGYSINELMHFAVIGMKDTLAVVNGKKRLNGITTDELLMNPQDREMAKDLVFMQEKLKEYQSDQPTDISRRGTKRKQFPGS